MIKCDYPPARPSAGSSQGHRYAASCSSLCSFCLTDAGTWWPTAHKQSMPMPKQELPRSARETGQGGLRRASNARDREQGAPRFQGRMRQVSCVVVGCSVCTKTLLATVGASQGVSSRADGLTSFQLSLKPQCSPDMYVTFTHFVLCRFLSFMHVNVCHGPCVEARGQLKELVSFFHHAGDQTEIISIGGEHPSLDEPH